MRISLVAAVCASACSYTPPRNASSEPDAFTDGAADAGAIDTPAAKPFCDGDPTLLVCFSFDADPLATTLANEGMATVTAQLTNVGGIASPLGRAALLDTTSQIRVPPNAQTTGIVATEAWVRIDADPPVGQRVGIIDADATSSAVSFFYYFPSPNRQIRFELGQQLFLDFTLDLGSWHYLAQVCDNATLTAYVDGTKIGERAGCTPGDATTFGLQFGQNNTGSGGDQWLVGAIDGVRLWTAPLSPTTICQTAGRSDCL